MERLKGKPVAEWIDERTKAEVMRLIEDEGIVRLRSFAWGAKRVILCMKTVQRRKHRP